jgi:cytochrome c biogenesis protein CcdA
MYRLFGLIVSIGLADSLNPSTIAPALYLASGERPRRRVIEFTVAVFAVYLAGGALIALGPGQLLRSLLPHVHRTERDVAELVAGVLLIAGGALLWNRREPLSERALPGGDPRRSSSMLLGATITAVELPTAFPYFAAIAAIGGSGLNPARQVTLLIVFNVCFVLPLIAIAVTVAVAGPRAQERLTSARSFFERRWPHLLSCLLMLVGGVALVLGGTGLAAQRPGRVGGFFRHLRRALHLRR